MTAHQPYRSDPSDHNPAGPSSYPPTTIKGRSPILSTFHTNTYKSLICSCCCGQYKNSLWSHPMYRSCNNCLGPAANNCVNSVLSIASALRLAYKGPRHPSSVNARTSQEVQPVLIKTETSPTNRRLLRRTRQFRRKVTCSEKPCQPQIQYKLK